jgi:DNA-binding transcriptional regulator YdaS (Cro superfamily)
MSRIGIDALEVAVAVLGSQAAVGKVVDVSQPAVSQIVSGGKRVPAEWVLPIERATREAGQEVSRHDLRPDIYPRDEVTVPTPVAEQFNPQPAE